MKSTGVRRGGTKGLHHSPTLLKWVIIVISIIYIYISTKISISLVIIVVTNSTIFIVGIFYCEY